MGQYLLPLVVALTVASVVFGVTVLITGNDRGLGEVEPDGRAVPLPGNRPLAEQDIADVRFDIAVRGYRMAQVDQALRRTAYDIGYKDELIGVLEAEVAALREGRTADAEVLRRAREAAGGSRPAPEGAAIPPDAPPGEPRAPQADGPAAERPAAPPASPPPPPSTAPPANAAPDGKHAIIELGSVSPEPAPEKPESPSEVAARAADRG